MHLTLQTVLLVVPFLFLAGFVDSIAGGGGLISMPIYLLAGLSPHQSVATNKFHATCGTSLATIRYIKHGKINKKAFLYSIIFSIVGSAIGAKLNTILSERYIEIFLIISIPIIIFIMFIKKNTRSLELTERSLFIRCAIVALIIGLYDGFYGPGTGTLLIFALTTFCGFDLTTASGNAKLLNMTSNISSFVVFLFSGNIVWSIGIIATISNLLGNYIGAGLAIKSGSKIIKPIFLVTIGILFITTIINIFT